MYTEISEIKQIVASAHNYFNTDKTKNLVWRKQMINSVKRFLIEEEQNIKTCLKKDLKQIDFLAEVGEIATIKQAADYVLSHLKEWTSPNFIKDKPLTVWPAKVYTIKEPLGVCAIFGVWNFPFRTTLEPLINALAAGNCVILKPSEVAPACSDFLAKNLGKYVDSKAVKIITGGVEQATELLKTRLDHIFYTGNSSVGKIVMAAAAKNLTPVTLELGGKNPAILTESANIPLAARRITWGKVQNMGQACVAPDYVLVPKSKAADFCAQAIDSLKQFFGEDVSRWGKNKDLSRIVNSRHFERITTLLEEEKGDVLIGGKFSAQDLFIEPTLILSDEKSPFMREEIFGPVLVIIPTESLDDSIKFVRRFEKPLALYIFSRDSNDIKAVLNRTSSGGVAINDTLLQASIVPLPFGGVGHSGMGKNFGLHGFNLFSHERSVLHKSEWFDFPVRYAPYSPWKLNLVRMMGRYSSATSALFSGRFCLAVFAGGLGGVGVGIARYFEFDLMGIFRG